jgi:hypothetical protein
MCVNARDKGRNSGGLRDEFVGARFEGSRFVRFSGHGREHQDGNSNMHRAKLANQLDAISRCWMGSALRSEIEFEQDRIELLLFESNAALSPKYELSTPGIRSPQESV